MLAALSWVVCLGLPLAAYGQAAAPGQAGQPRQAGQSAPEPADPAWLPPPLADIQSNIRDLESSGHLQVERVRFQPAGSIYGSAAAFVWTLRTRTHVTSRLVEWWLNEHRDVRIYDERDGKLVELFETLLVFPDRIHVGAINGTLLKPGEYLDIWFYVTEEDIRRLGSSRADRLVLSGRQEHLKSEKRRASVRRGGMLP